MAIAYVQSVSVQSSGATSLTTPAFTSTTGNFLAAHLSYYPFAFFSSITDSHTNTWLQSWISESSPLFNDTKGALYYAQNITGGASHTVTMQIAPASSCALAVAEFSGLATTFTLNATNHATGFTAPYNSGDVTTDTATQLLIGSGGVGHSAAEPVVQFYTDIASRGATVNEEGILLSYALVSSTGTYGYSYRFYTTPGQNDSAGLASFKGTAIAFVQVVTAVSFGTVASITVPAMANTSGNCLVAAGAIFTRSFSGTPVADTASNTWANAWVQNGGGSGHAALYYALNIATAAANLVTFTVPGGNDFVAFSVAEFSGVLTVGALDQTNSAASSGEPHASGNITTTTATQLLIGNGSCSHVGDTRPYSVTNNAVWNTVVALGDNSPNGVMFAYRIVSSIDTYDFEWNNGRDRGPGNDLAGIATFRAAAAAGSITVIKVTEPVSGGDTPFPFSTTGGLTPDSFTLLDGQSQAFTGLAPGTYGVTETPPSGWTVSYSVSDGSPHTAIVLGAGEIITVGVTNTVATTTSHLRRYRRFSLPQSENAEIFIPRLEIVGAMGVGNDDDPDPEIKLRLSRDGGNTWETARTMTIGAAGEYMKRAYLTRLGRGRNLVAEVYSDSPVFIAWIACNLPQGVTKGSS